MNNCYKGFYLTGLLLLLTVLGFAQVKVTGVVKGADNGLTLPGATIYRVKVLRQMEMGGIRG